MTKKIYRQGNIIGQCFRTLICVIFLSCNNEIEQSERKNGFHRDTIVEWINEPSFRNANPERPLSIMTKKIKSTEIIRKLFSLSEFGMPDSLLVTCYTQVVNDTLVLEYYSDKVQFLDWSAHLQETPNRLISNKNVLNSFQNIFTEQHFNFVQGYADISNNEICFMFGEGNWINKERFIYSCEGCIRISDQGHSQHNFKIYWNKKLLDSANCDVGYY